MAYLTFKKWLEKTFQRNPKVEQFNSAYFWSRDVFRSQNIFQVQTSECMEIEFLLSNDEKFLLHTYKYTFSEVKLWT